MHRAFAQEVCRACIAGGGGVSAGKGARPSALPTDWAGRDVAARLFDQRVRGVCGVWPVLDRQCVWPVRDSIPLRVFANLTGGAGAAAAPRQVFKRAEEKGIKIDVTERFKDRLVDEGYNPAYGARPLRRAIMRLLEDSMAERMLAGDIKVRVLGREQGAFFDLGLWVLGWEQRAFFVWALALRGGGCNRRWNHWCVIWREE
jgi:C-terminal, D2-small domain, of ClpB protein